MSVADRRPPEELEPKSQFEVEMNELKLGAIHALALDGVMVEPHNTVDLVRQFWVLILTFRGELVRLECAGADIEIGSFDLNLCPISCYQVTLTYQSMVKPLAHASHGFVIPISRRPGSAGRFAAS